VRVLVVSQYFWPESFRINAIVESLIERGIEVEVLTGKPNYPEGVIYSGYSAWGCQREQWKGATLYRAPLFPRGRNSHLRLLLNYLSFIFLGSACGSWMVRKRQYDVIFVYGLSPILLAIPALFIGWLKGKKVIIWVQDLWPQSLSATGYIRSRLMLGAVGKVVRFIYRGADLLLVQSRAFEAPVAALASGTPIVYYPNSVDDTFAIPATDETPQVEGLGEGFSVMFAGNIGAAQAVGVMVEAASFLKAHADIHFVVLGDGSCRDEMQKASALLVTLANRPIFAATVPNKVQAYLAAGRPIIACLNGEGARLVAEAGAGLATPAEDARALADTILRLYQMPAGEREEMGVNGRRYYQEHFDHEHLVDELIGHLQAVSQGRKDIE